MRRGVTSLAAAMRPPGDHGRAAPLDGRTNVFLPSDGRRFVADCVSWQTPPLTRCDKFADEIN
jgi:hypothetical protein